MNKKIVLLGSGELGKEFVIAAQRIGQTVIAVDSYENAPAMQVAHGFEVINMLDGAELDRIIAKHQPDFIVPEIEAIRTDDDDYYLIEINPRFPAWVYLAVGAGQNHPEALLKLALGETVEPFGEYEVGKLFIRYSYDMICDLADFQKISIVGEL